MRPLPPRRAGTMLIDGTRLVIAYRGLLAALYMVQLFVSGIAALAMAEILTSALGNSPVLDKAVDGDAIAVLQVLQQQAGLLGFMAWLIVAAALLYVVISWFCIGGLIATFRERPATRQETTECFGRGGARTFLAYGRLALYTLPLHALVVLATLFGLDAAVGAAMHTVSRWDALWSLLFALTPAAVLMWTTSAAIDFARVDLAAGSEQCAGRALMRSYRLLMTSPWPLAHLLVYYVAFATITSLYIAGTFNQPMSAIALLVTRQIVAIARYACKATLLAGQSVWQQDSVAPAGALGASTQIMGPKGRRGALPAVE